MKSLVSVLLLCGGLALYGLAYGNDESVNHYRDANKNTFTTLGTLLSGENQTQNLLRVEPVYSYKRISTTTSTTVQNVAGTLHAVTVNQAVASSVITLYDGLLSGTCAGGGGTIIGVITMPATLLQNHVTLLYDVSFGTGLCITTATGASDITVSYR